jgi:hypothetical protein
MLKYLLKKLLYALLSGKSHHRPPMHKPYGYSSSDYKYRHHGHHGHHHYRGRKYFTSS